MALHRSIILAILLAVCTTLVSAAAISRSEQSVEAPGQVYCGNLGDPVIYTTGDVDNGGPGFMLRDNDTTNTLQAHAFFLYENSRDTHPWKYALLNPGFEVFISVCPTFQGRLVRGSQTMNLDGGVHNLGTWVELSFEGPPSTQAWASVSLLQGCDGAATVAALDGRGKMVGFTQDIVHCAPKEALTAKSDGSMVIQKTVGDGASGVARDYELSMLDPMTNASIVEQYTPAIGSHTGRFAVTMYSGTY